MLATLAVMLGFVDSMRGAAKDPEFRAIGVVALIQWGVGIAVYMIVEGWGLLDAAYFCVVSLATVGYGDLAPETAIGKLFTIVYLLAGVGLFVMVVSRLASARVERRQALAARRQSRKSARRQVTDSNEA